MLLLAKSLHPMTSKRIDSLNWDPHDMQHGFYDDVWKDSQEDKV